jgi:hypothetical protein
MPPKKLTTIGAIRKVVEMPCAIPPLLYVEAIVPTVLDLFHAVTKPVWKQEVKLALGHSWLKALKHDMRGAERDLPPILNTGLEKLYVAAEFLDKSMFYLWVAGLGARAAYDWASLVHEWTPCSKSPHKQMASGAGCVGNFIPNGDWGEAPAFVNSTGHGNPFVTANVSTKAGETWDMLFGVEWPPSIHGTYTIDARIIEETTGAVVASGGPATTFTTHSAHIICYAPNLGLVDRHATYQGQVRLRIATGHILLASPTTGYLSVRHMGNNPIFTPRPIHKHPPRISHPGKQPRAHNYVTPSHNKVRPLKKSPTHEKVISVHGKPQREPKKKDNQRASNSNRRTGKTPVK